MAPTPSPGPIETRRTARQFDPDLPLPDSLLTRILELATLAPSPMNLQPWRFLVVRDPLNRRKLRGCTFGERRITDAPAVIIVLAYLHSDRTDLPEILQAMLDRAAITPDDAARLRATATREWTRRDPALAASRAAMLAAGTLMIAAEALGLASAWLEGFDDEPIRQAFGIPDDHALCGLIPLGYPATDPPFPGRLGLDRVAFDEHFGKPWPTGALDD